MTATPLALIGNMGAPEVLVIGLALLLLFGRRLPEVARSLGHSVTSFKRGLTDPPESDDDSASA